MNTNTEALLRAVNKLNGNVSALARAANTSRQFMRAVLNSERPLPPKKALLIERATGVSRKELFPDDWAEIWPELENVV